MFGIVKKIHHKAKSVNALRQMINKAKNIKVLKRKKIGSVYFRGAELHDYSQLASVYKKLNNIPFSASNKKLLKSCSEKLVVIAEKKIGEGSLIVGMNLFYINPRDFQENTIHEGFIGVLPEFEGNGIASQMRKIAINHFKQAGFSGISSRISKSNIGSLRSAEKLEFKVVEEYFDEEMNEKRYYLVRNLQNNGEIKSDK